MDPIFKPDLSPNAQGLWERCFLLECLSTDRFDVLKKFAAGYGALQNYTEHNVTPNWQPTYVTYRQDDSYVLVSQGTENIQQWLANAAGAMLVGVDPSGNKNQRIWQLVASDMWAAVLMDPVFDSTVSILDLSGFSYGAAVVGLITFLSARDRPNLFVSTATFGSPKARWFGKVMRPPGVWFRVRARDDPIPSLPMSGGYIGGGFALTGGPLTRSLAANWVHDGAPVLISDQGELTTSFSEDDASTQALYKGPNRWLYVHNLYRYRQNLEQTGLVVRPPWLDAASVPQTPQPVLQPDATLPPPPLDQASIDALNRIYYPVGPPVITPGNIRRLESAGLILLSGDLRRPATIPESGAKMPTPTQSGYTKVTFCINNGVYGRLESHVLQGGLYDPITASRAKVMAGNRAQLLGTTGTLAAPVSGKSRGSPQVQFIKLQDAFFPKKGFVIDGGNTQWLPAPRTLAYPADVLSTAIAVRMFGQQIAIVNAAGTVANDSKAVNLLVNGQPDDFVQEGVIQFGFQRGAVNYRDDIVAYLNLLLGGTLGAWGFVGQAVVPDANPPILAQVTSYVFNTDPTKGAIDWHLTLDAGTPWNSGSRVKLTKANKTWNGTYRITKNPDNTYTLKNGPVQGHTIPKTGQMSLVALPNGQRVGGFYQYSDYVKDAIFSPVPQMKVSKKDQGREFLNVTFRRNQRRER